MTDLAQITFLHMYSSLCSSCPCISFAGCARFGFDVFPSCFKSGTIFKSRIRTVGLVMSTITDQLQRSLKVLYVHLRECISTEQHSFLLCLSTFFLSSRIPGLCNTYCISCHRLMIQVNCVFLKTFLLSF